MNPPQPPFKDWHAIDETHAKCKQPGPRNDEANEKDQTKLDPMHDMDA